MKTSFKRPSREREMAESTMSTFTNGTYFRQLDKARFLDVNSAVRSCDKNRVQCFGENISQLSPASPMRNGRLQRAKALGLAECQNSSFELNQSFPSLKHRSHLEDNFFFLSPRAGMDTIRGDGLNSCRFSGGRRRCSFSSIRPANESQSGAYDHLLASEASTTVSATLCPSVSISQPPTFHKSVMLNPNKAVFTFDFKSMQILVVNQMACRLLGFSSEELSALTLAQLLNRQHSHTANALAEEHLDTHHGTTLGVSGKVVEMVSKDGTVIPVSLWLRRLQMDDRCLAVAEPVERRIARFEVDASGHILWLDQDAAQLFQYQPEEVEGESIMLLIPAFLLPSCPDSLPKEVRKQKATGRTKYGSSFPLCLRLSERLGDGSGDSSVAAITYSVVVWVFSNMSGLLVLAPDGTIEQCNHHFTNIMFGYPQALLVGKHITTVIPNFANDMECGGDDTLLPPFQLGDELADAALNTDSTTPQAWRSNDDTESRSTNLLSLDRSNRTDCLRLVPSISQLTDITNKLNINDDDSTSVGSTLQNEMSPVKSYKIFSSASPLPSEEQKENQLTDETSEQLVTADGTTCEDISHSEDDTLNGNGDDVSLTSSHTGYSASVSIELSACKGTNSTSMCTCTSHPSRYNCPTPAPTPTHVELENYTQGHFVGFGKHRDGSNIELVYQVRLVQLNCGRRLYCVWVSRDGEEEGEEDPRLANLTLTSSLDSSAVEHSLGQEIQSRALSGSRLSSMSMLTQCEDELTAGEYGERYTTLQQIGKGAYGYVKMAFRNADGMLVITKFIHKKKVHQQSWVEDPSLSRPVPLEVSLLTTIKHPNVVQVLDVLENESFIQMVMEKHGAGMDLFEFVDRRPKLDEPLTSYIFRQIVSAVEYLHSLRILHRDIKDENVIIDQRFHAKLIDFGSATFMSSERLFSTFYGTVEYCSPEVLAGNKYEGPELEVWSLGVTLYVLTFGENPFFDVEETLRAELRPPGTASSQLLELLHSMLERDPNTRCTMSKLASHPWITQPVDPNNYHFQDVVSCLPHEYDPPAFYADYRLCRPASGSPGALQGAVAPLGDDDEDQTDLATSNSLTSLTPVDEGPSIGPSVEPSHLTDVVVPRPTLQSKPLSGKSSLPPSSTPLKHKSAVSNNSSASYTLSTNEVSSTHHSHSNASSSSLSPASSSSSSNGKSSSSIALSTNRKDNDSLAQHLLEDFSDRLLSYAGAPVSPIFGRAGCGSSLTDEEDYLNEEFEDDDDENINNDFEPAKVLSKESVICDVDNEDEPVIDDDDKDVIKCEDAVIHPNKRRVSLS